MNRRISGCGGALLDDGSLSKKSVGQVTRLDLKEQLKSSRTLGT